MPIHRWKDLKHKVGPERMEQIRQDVRRDILDENLRGVRELLGKTQAEIAAVIEMTQGQVSDVERREDHLVSTLRRYVEALGGELEVTANFGKKRIRLHGV